MSLKLVDFKWQSRSLYRIITPKLHFLITHSDYGCNEEVEINEYLKSCVKYSLTRHYTRWGNNQLKLHMEFPVENRRDGDIISKTLFYSIVEEKKLSLEDLL